MWGIAEKAKQLPKYRFRNLYGLLNEELLIDCWSDLRKNAAIGVDNISTAEYELNLEKNISELVEKLKKRVIGHGWSEGTIYQRAKAKCDPLEY